MVMLLSRETIPHHGVMVTRGCPKAKQPQSCSSWVEAVDRLHPDVVITDINMPGISGLEAIRRLKDAGCRSTMIVLTVSDEPEMVDEARCAGALGFVVKNRMVKDLPRAIEEGRAGREFISSI